MEKELNDVADNFTNDNDAVKSPEAMEIDALREELSVVNDKYLRSLADLENTKRRAGLDIESAVRNRAMSVAENFIPLVDAIDAALSLSPDDEGLQTLSRAANNALAKVGITRIESVGRLMNPALHNAVSTVDTDDDAAPNTIISELQPGYMFGDSVLRNAVVVVKK